MIEFTDSASARIALQMTLGDAKVCELQQSSDKKRKQQSKKSPLTRLAKEESYNSSSCASGSEAEDERVRHKKPTYGYHMYHAYPGHSFQGIVKNNF